MLDVPVQANTSTNRTDELERVAKIETNTFRRVEWLNHLEAAVALSADEDLPDWPFERTKEMHSPLDLAD